MFEFVFVELLELAETNRSKLDASFSVGVDEISKKTLPGFYLINLFP